MNEERNPRGKTSILIADDHALFREGIRRILEDAGGFRVVGEAADGKDAVKRAKSSKPDVVLMDIGMPRLNGIEATRQTSRSLPGTKVLVVTVSNNEDHVSQALRAGAAGYLLKDCSAAELIKGIESVSAGDLFFSPRISWLLMEGYMRKMGGPVKGSGFDRLTGREREVFQFVAEGRRKKEIAAQLGSSVKTVEVHRAHAMEKLGVHNAADMVKFVIRKGIVEVE